jgi:hypothetical protein
VSLYTVLVLLVIEEFYQSNCSIFIICIANTCK